MSETTSSSPPSVEFRFYRRFLSGLVLAMVSLGSAYLLTSVGVTLYRQRTGVATGAPVSSALTVVEVSSCWEEASDVTLSLQKHLEKFHHLLGGYSSTEAQRWAEEGAVWRTQWKLLGDRCRFRTRGHKGRPEMDALVGVWLELDETERVYTRALSRFGQDQAPRLDRIRERLKKIGDRLEQRADTPGPQGEAAP